MENNRHNTGVIVVKAGSDVLVQKDNALDIQVIDDRIAEIVQLMRAGSRVLLVTSGAKAKGMKALGISSIDKDDKVLTQVACAVGQGRIMRAYEEALVKAMTDEDRETGRLWVPGQLLLTRNELATPDAALSVRNVFERMWQTGKVLPIVNANDPISDEELQNTFGDNDELANRVAKLMHAEIVVLLSSVHGLQRDLHDPTTVIPRINPLLEDLRHFIVEQNSNNGKGGMKSKYDVSEDLALQGIDVHLGFGKAMDAMKRLIRGEIGTLFSIKDDAVNRD